MRYWAALAALSVISFGCRAGVCDFAVARQQQIDQQSAMQALQAVRENWHDKLRDQKEDSQRQIDSLTSQLNNANAQIDSLRGQLAQAQAAAYARH